MAYTLQTPQSMQQMLNRLIQESITSRKRESRILFHFMHLNGSFPALQMAFFYTYAQFQIYCPYFVAK